MNHNQAKDLLLQNKEVAKEYKALEALYEIKRQLIELRNEQGISQEELARKVGTKQSAISRLESGDYNPSVEFLSKVASALGKELHIIIR